jgi:hypothetical protein
MTAKPRDNETRHAKILRRPPAFEKGTTFSATFVLGLAVFLDFRDQYL